MRGETAVVVAAALLAFVLGLACSESDPPAPPASLGECLPVLYPCNDYIHECARPVITDEGELVPVGEQHEEGAMGSGVTRHYTRRMHCIDSECRPIYVLHTRRPGSSARYAPCGGGRRDFPSCVVAGESCAARWE